MDCRHRQQRLVLAKFLNGDLTSSEVRVYHQYVHVANDAVREATLLDIDKYVVPMLVPVACPVFSRSRWNGADAAIRWAGLLIGHYAGSLFRLAVEDFTGHKPQAPPASHEEGQLLLHSHL